MARLFIHPSVVAAVLALACLSLSFRGNLGGNYGEVSWAGEGDGQVELFSGSSVETAAARELAAAGVKENSLEARISQVRRIKEDLSSQIVGGDMRRVLNSGGQQRVAHLRELASDAEKLQQLAKKTEARGQDILANSALIQEDGCNDKHSQMCGKESCCTFWARKGECHAGNKAWMSVECTNSCSLCSHSAGSTLSQEETPVGRLASKATAAAPTAPRSQSHDAVPRPTGLSWPSPSSTTAAAAHASLERRAAVSRVHPRMLGKTGFRHRSGGLGVERRAEKVDEHLMRPERVEVSLRLAGITPEDVGRAQVDDAIREAVASVGHGLTVRDVAVDSVTPCNGMSHDAPQHKAAARASSRGKMALLKQHVYGKAMPVDMSDAFYGGATPMSRRRLLSAPSSSPSSPGVDIRLHVLLPAGADRDAIVASLKRSLKANVERELGRRGVDTGAVTVHHVRQAAAGVKHASGKGAVAWHGAEVPPKQDAVFAAWAKQFLLGSIGGGVAKGTQLRDVSKGRRRRRGRESLGHRSSGLERTARIPPIKKPWPFPAYMASKDQGLDLIPRDLSTGAGLPPVWSFGDDPKPVQWPSQSAASKLMQKGKAANGKVAESKNSTVTPEEEEEEEMAEYDDPTGWKFESEMPPLRVKDIDLPKGGECGPECIKRRQDAKDEVYGNARKKLVIAREHVIEDATTLKHLLDAVGEEEKLLEDKKEQKEEAKAKAERAEEEEEAAQDEDEEEEEAQRPSQDIPPDWKTDGSQVLPVDLGDGTKFVPISAGGGDIQFVPISDGAQATGTSAAAAVESGSPQAVAASGGDAGAATGEDAADGSGSPQDQRAAEEAATPGGDSGSPQAEEASGDARASKDEAASGSPQTQDDGGVMHTLASYIGDWMGGKGSDGSQQGAAGGGKGAAKSDGAVKASRGRVQTLSEGSFSGQAKPPGYLKGYRANVGKPLWHTHPVPPTAEWDSLEVANANPLLTAAEQERDYLQAVAEGRRQARIEQQANKAKAKRKIRPVNVHVKANIDSAQGMAYLPAWYKKELAERKASGADKDAFSLNLGINVRSPHEPPEPPAAEEEAKEEEEEEEAEEAMPEAEGVEEDGDKPAEGGAESVVKGVASMQGLAYTGAGEASGKLSAAAAPVREPLASRLRGEEADVGRTMSRIKELAGGV